MTRIVLNFLNAPILVLLIVLGMGIQTSLFGFWPLNYLQPNIVLLAVIWCALRRGFFEGGVLTLILAEIAELHSAAPSGVFLIAYMTIYLLVRGSARLVVIQDFSSYIAVTLVSSVGWKTVTLAVLHLLGASTNQWRHTLLFLFPGAVIEASVGVWVYRWLEKFDQLTFKNARLEGAVQEEEFSIEGLE